jgi:hypothetical protein
MANWMNAISVSGYFPLHSYTHFGIMIFVLPSPNTRLNEHSV